MVWLEYGASSTAENTLKERNPKQWAGLKLIENVANFAVFGQDRRWVRASGKDVGIRGGNVEGRQIEKKLKNYLPKAKKHLVYRKLV